MRGSNQIRGRPVEAGKELFAVDGRLRTFFERLKVPDHSFASEAGELEILSEFERICWTGVFAQSAEHAPAEIIGESNQLFSPRFLVAFACNYDQVFRAGQRAEIARYTQRLVSVRIHIQAGRAAISFSNLRPLQGILLGINFFGILVPERDEKSLDEVQQKNLPHDAGKSHNPFSIPPA